MKALGRSATAAAVTAVLSAPLAAALTAWCWKWPVFMVGIVGGTPRAALGAAFTSAIYIAFGGIIILGGLGACAGHLLRSRSLVAAIVAGLAVASAAAVAVPLMSPT